jgi:type IV pilus assembly protein PilC
MVYDMTAIGEESGSLDKMLKKVAEFYTEETNYIINNISALINPIMMVGVGGLIGGTLIGLYLPVFQMASYIK